MTNFTYTDYHFTADGINFVSRIADHSPFVEQISTLPTELFIEMNIDAVKELLGRPSLMTQAEILAELERVNEGATHSWILLGANE
jgi:hypothetical protein